jgi:hypothetical protein
MILCLFVAKKQSQSKPIRGVDEMYGFEYPADLSKSRQKRDNEPNMEKLK